MKNRYVLAFDLPLVAIAAIGAFVLRFDWTFFAFRREYLFFTVAAVLIKPIVFRVFGLYNRYWRYASVFDLVLVSVAVSVSSILMGAIVALGVLWGAVDQFSRTVVVIDWLLTLLFVAGARFSVRLVAESVRTTAVGMHRVLVVGAGDAGILAVREMRKNAQLGLQPVGYVDDDPTKHGQRILGIPVAGPLNDLARAAALFRAQDLVIAMPKAPGAVVRQVAEAGRLLGLRSRIMPGMYELLEGSGTGPVRDIEISDLLRRTPVVPSENSVAYLRDRVVLITGAGGSIGGELSRQAAAAGIRKLILLGHGENSIFNIQRQLRSVHPDLPVQALICDIRDRERLTALIRLASPSVVFHAAAHKHVPLMEENAVEAITNNVLGTRNVVDACLAAHVERLVCISSDKAVAPSSIMGASKRIAEFVVRRAASLHGRKFACVRFGNVLGSRGSVVETFKQQIAAGGPVTITHPDMTRFFMTIPEAVHLVIEAGGLGQPADLFVLNMGRPVKIVDLAHDLIALSGLREDQIAIEFSGMRLGEKLHESLMEPGAVVTNVTADIMRVEESAEPEPSLLESYLADFAALGPTDDEAAVRLMRQAVPTFQPPIDAEATRAIASV